MRTEAPPLERAIGRFGLPGAESPPIDVPADAWPSLLGTLSTGRMTGMAVAAAEGGHLRLTDSQATELLDRHRDAMVWALTVERRLLGLAGAFDDAGIDLLVLKGTAMAHAVYPDPSWRSFGDLDLLVRTSDWARACDVLTGLSFRRRLPEPRPGFDERFGKAAVHTNGDGIEVDLHRTLVIGPFGLWIQPDELVRRSVRFSLGGHDLRRLDDTALMLHACMHASLGWRPPLLWTLRDVAQVAWSGRVDWDELVELSRRWRLRAVLRHALEATSEALEVRLPAEASAVMAVDPPRRERRALDSYVTERRGRGGTELSTLRAIPGLRGKAAYVRSLLVPSAEFLEARTGRFGERPSYLRRWMVPIRWLTRRRR